MAKEGLEIFVLIISIASILVTVVIRFMQVENSIKLLAKELDFTRNETARSDVHEKQNIKDMEQSLQSLRRTVHKLIDYINADASKNGKNLFHISKYDE